MAIPNLVADLQVELTRVNRVIADLQAKLAVALAQRDDIQADINLLTDPTVQAMSKPPV